MTVKYYSWPDLHLTNMVKYNILQQSKRDVILKYNLLSFIEKLKLNECICKIFFFFFYFDFGGGAQIGS